MAFMYLLTIIGLVMKFPMTILISCYLVWRSRFVFVKIWIALVL